MLMDRDAPLLGVAADIGGTNARFALAHRTASGSVALSERRVLHTGDFPTLEAAFETYVADLNARPVHAVLAVAGPIANDEVKLTNSAWTFRQSSLPARLKLETLRLINDFEAIAYALPQLGANDFQPLGGPAFALPSAGRISLVGPGSGLGVGLLLRQEQRDLVLPSEGGHANFAPADEIDAHILRIVAKNYPHVSVERLVCGEGLVKIYEALALIEGRAVAPQHSVQLWDAAIAGTDPHAVQARDRWLMMLGTFAGDIALVHRAQAVVLAGGILPRFGDKLDAGGLLTRYRAKGRFEAMMRDIPIALLQYPDPGLMGAASLLLRNT